jgi:ATP-dependent exoDNAse (exonuclease V) beta subunit
MCEHSNFIALKEYNKNLFRYLYKAEKLYIDGHYCSIPNKLRSFLESFLRAVLLTKGYEKKYLNSIKLSDLRKDFQQYYLESYAWLNTTVKNLQADGNDGSHPNETDDKFDEKDIAYQLFENATTLVNFLLSDIYDADIKKKEIFFCESNLPKKEFHNNDIQQTEDIQKPQIVVNENSQQQPTEAETNTDTKIDFTSEQQQIIELTTGQHFLQAPAGSGKIAILTERVKLAIDNYDERQIICLSPSKSMATELQLQIKKVIGTQQPFIGTIHSFCLKIIKDSASIIEDDKHKTNLQDFIDNFKNNDSSKFDKVLSLGLEEISNQKITIDFIQIDEAQDLSEIQWQIIHQLCHENTHLLVVGDDPKQSIYGFRNADNRLLVENTKNYTVHKLIQNNNYNNYNQNIIKLLNGYQKQHWPQQQTLQTTSIQAESNTTSLVKYANFDEELNKNIAIIKQKIALGNTNIAILLKRNEDCEKYYQQLQTAGIKCYYPNSTEENPEYDVIVSTIHYAKSLKFDTVFIPQATRKNYWRTDKGEDLQLLYIALSRATTNLTVSYTTEEYQAWDGTTKTNQLTAFLEPCKNDFNETL